MNQIVNADIKHQKHQALITLHCKYVKITDIMEAMVTKTFRIKNQIVSPGIPITKNAVTTAMIM